MRCKEGSYNPRKPPTSIYFTIECEINDLSYLIHTLELIHTYVRYKWRRLSIWLDSLLLLTYMKLTFYHPKRTDKHVRGAGGQVL